MALEQTNNEQIKIIKRIEIERIKRNERIKIPTNREKCKDHRMWQRPTHIILLPTLFTVCFYSLVWLKICFLFCTQSSWICCSFTSGSISKVFWYFRVCFYCWVIIPEIKHRRTFLLEHGLYRS